MQSFAVLRCNQLNEKGYQSSFHLYDVYANHSLELTIGAITKIFQMVYIRNVKSGRSVALSFQRQNTHTLTPRLVI